jgi:F-box domain
MAPLTRLRKKKTFQFLTLPNELLVMVSELLPLKDRISLADTCTACRSLVSDAQSIAVCTTAGLSIPSGIKPRAMAKLLYRPRVGISNWSLDDGIPKGARY